MSTNKNDCEPLPSPSVSGEEHGRTVEDEIYREAVYSSHKHWPIKMECDVYGKEWDDNAGERLAHKNGFLEGYYKKTEDLEKRFHKWCEDYHKLHGMLKISIDESRQPNEGAKEEEFIKIPISKLEETYLMNNGWGSVQARLDLIEKYREQSSHPQAGEKEGKELDWGPDNPDWIMPFNGIDLTKPPQ